MKNFSLTILILLFASFASADPEVISGCQGEGCGCTREKKFDKEAILYEKMDAGSKVIGKFKAGTAASLVKVTTRVLKRGLSKVTAVNESFKTLKPGDEIHTVFSLGEGFYQAKIGDKLIEFEFDQVTLQEIEKPVYEVWAEIKVGKRKGYAQSFPFLGCLE